MDGEILKEGSAIHVGEGGGVCFEVILKWARAIGSLSLVFGMTDWRIHWARHSDHSEASSWVCHARL